MKKFLMAAMVFAVLSAACFAAYRMHGVSVDADGFLHEAFGFIPLASLFCLLSVVCAVSGLIAGLIRMSRYK